MSTFKQFFFERGWISILAFTASMLFCFIVFPILSSKGFLPNDIDGHGSLALGLHHCGTLAFYPSCEPTVQRAPIYPLVLLGIIALNPSWYPSSVIVFQCFIFALTVQVLFSIVRSFASQHRAQLVSLACALHPYLIWFTSRIWIEHFIVLLFTLLVYCLITYANKASLLKAFIIGAVLGISCITKQTFLPYVLIIPLGLYYLNFKWTHALLILVVSLLFIAPWTFRNWNLTHTVIPVQLLLGYNMQIGDYLIENPASREWWLKAYKEKVEPFEIETREKLKGRPSWEKEIYIEKKALSRSLEHYLKNPFFLLKKLVFNLWAFWFMGGINTYYLPWLYVLFLFLQAAILLFFLDATWRVWRNFGARSIHSLVLVLVWLYFGSHLPVLSESRFSLPLIPTMMAYGFGWPFRRNASPTVPSP